jgi:hypothetical protein
MKPEKPNSFLRSIDIFDKISDQELRVSTKTGAVLSFFLSVIGLIFALIKIVRLFRPKIYRGLTLNTSLMNQQDFVNISVAVTVNLPCYFLHLDAMDSLGFSQFDINSTANLRRITRTGKMIGIVNETLKQQCFPCYGALPDNVCCNSCEQLMLLFAFRGMAARPNEWIQCREKKRPMASIEEKCLVKGKISVNKVPGTFHIAPGRNQIIDGGGHSHDLSYDFPNLDLSHQIDIVRFGPEIPTAQNPLKRIRVNQRPDTPMAYRYLLMVTPILYVKDGVERKRGYEYTAMITRRVISGLFREAPGIFFSYSFTPYWVTVTAVSRSFAQFLTSTSGFLSGSFAAVTMLDLFMQRIEFDWFSRKKEEPKVEEEKKEEAK